MIVVVCEIFQVKGGQAVAHVHGYTWARGGQAGVRVLGPTQAGVSP